MKYDVNGVPLIIDYFVDGITFSLFDDFNELSDDVWSHETGNVRNNELQFYKKGNVSTKESCLVITAKRETACNKSWTSGSVTGQHKQRLGYGKIEVRAKFPNVTGAFGAIWTLGANHWIDYREDEQTANSSPTGSVPWPQCGEIDITETIPGDAKTAKCNLWAYNGGSLGNYSSPAYDPEQFHVYFADICPDRIDVGVDGVIYHSYRDADLGADSMKAYKLPQYIIINLAVGASGGVPPADCNEMVMLVDWVRYHSTNKPEIC